MPNVDSPLLWTMRRKLYYGMKVNYTTTTLCEHVYQHFMGITDKMIVLDWTTQ